MSVMTRRRQRSQASARWMLAWLALVLFAWTVARAMREEPRMREILFGAARGPREQKQPR